MASRFPDGSTIWLLPINEIPFSTPARLTATTKIRFSTARRGGCVFRGGVSSDRPVRRQDQDVGSEQRQATRGLREPEIVADEDSKPSYWSVEHLVRAWAESRQAVNPKERQVGLPINSDKPRGPHRIAEL